MTRVVAALIAAGTLLLAAQTRSPLLHATRQAPTDLQVGESQFVSYQDLLRLPQVKFTTSDDSNFVPPAQVSGVPLDELERALGSDADMVVAIRRRWVPQQLPGRLSLRTPSRSGVDGEWRGTAGLAEDS